MTKKQLEMRTSAVTLSDMEIFVFPELMYSLVLANIMSPILWQWRNLDCFKKLEGKSSYKKLMRLKQFIMDEYEFNLDLNTWGLTSKDNELKRFEDYISPDDLARSNALFGYTGDKYYFDVDIRKHFGLDKYEGDIIPYWKTETIEAMDAFRFKKGYKTGAGECVSLSALYAAAAFVVCGIPLENIYMVLTPLHSQNFIDLNGGVITNNRRLVTKAMWFNGTEISNKAQRALKNERVTIIAHNTGNTHCFYNDATIDKNAYKDFTKKLDNYLTAELNMLNFANFLRSHHEYQRYFQFCRDCRGNAQFIKAEQLFGYEHGSNFRIADSTHEKLLSEVDHEDYTNYKLWERICTFDFEQFIRKKKVNLKTAQGRADLKEFASVCIEDVDKFVEDLATFLYTKAKLPDLEKKYIDNVPIDISLDMTRQQVIDYLASIRNKNLTADLAFYAYRDMTTCDWQPFTKAAVERNPVSIEMFENDSVDDVYEKLQKMDNESIYDGTRLAQPDEVANYNRGDGIEKAFLLANIILNRNPAEQINIEINGGKVLLKAGKEFTFSSQKGLKKHIASLSFRA